MLYNVGFKSPIHQNSENDQKKPHQYDIIRFDFSIMNSASESKLPQHH